MSGLSIACDLCSTDGAVSLELFDGVFKSMFPCLTRWTRTSAHVVSLAAEEADILCPPVAPQCGDQDADPTRLSESPVGHGAKDPDSGQSGLMASVKNWVAKWHFAAQLLGHLAPTGYRRPIPFDRLIFSRLDRWIVFDPREQSREEPVPKDLFSPDSIDPRMVHQPDQPIHHDPATRLVVPHPPLAPWEDIPPYQRMRGYSDQPAYTDDYDDFLWLPRDPLSTLDLDDTVEMRLSLTTSAGGSGRIGDWPPEHLEEEVSVKHSTTEPEWQEVVTDYDRDNSVDHDRPPMSPVSFETHVGRSPSTQSERRLIEPVETTLSPLIGSEVAGSEGTGQYASHRFRNVALAIGSLRRPRPNTSSSAETGISLQTLTPSAAHGPVPPSPTTPTRPSRQESESSYMLSPMRVSTPSPIASLRPLPVTSDSLNAGIPQTDPYRSQTLPAGLPPSSTDLGVVNDVFATPPQPQSAPAQVHAAGQVPPPRSGTHLTFAASELGRSPSGRRPHGRLRSGTVNSRASDRSLRPHPRTGSGILRTASILSRDRTASSVSAAQRALLNEVMEEEKLASQSAKHDEAELNEREKDEVLKERERLRKLGVDAHEPIRRASGTGSSQGGDTVRGSSMRRRGSTAATIGTPRP